jgi:hypothetical protein
MHVAVADAVIEVATGNPNGERVDRRCRLMRRGIEHAFVDCHHDIMSARDDHDELSRQAVANPGDLTPVEEESLVRRRVLAVIVLKAARCRLSTV